MLKIYAQNEEARFRSSKKWTYLRQIKKKKKKKKKKKLKKKFYSKKIFKQKTSRFFFHISRTNPWNEFNCLRIFKNLQSNSKVISYVLNNNFSYTQLTLAFVPQITFTMVQTLFSISSFFLFFSDICLVPCFAFRFFLFQKDFDIFHMLLFEAFLCAFDNRYFVIFIYRKSFSKNIFISFSYMFKS